MPSDIDSLKKKLSAESNKLDRLNREYCTCDKELRSFEQEYSNYKETLASHKMGLSKCST